MVNSVDQQTKESLGISSFLLTFMTNTPARLVAIQDFVVKVNSGIKQKYKQETKKPLTAEEASRKKELMTEIVQAQKLIAAARSFFSVSPEGNWCKVEDIIGDVYLSMYEMAGNEGIITIDNDAAWDMARGYAGRQLEPEEGKHGN